MYVLRVVLKTVYDSELFISDDDNESRQFNEKIPGY